jgi:hypothetical protein
LRKPIRWTNLHAGNLSAIELATPYFRYVGTLNSFSCPSCNAVISAPAVPTASSGQCPYCRQMISLPPPQVVVEPSTERVHRSGSRRRNQRKKKQNQVILAGVSICVLLLTVIFFALAVKPNKDKNSGSASTNQEDQRQSSLNTQRSTVDIDVSGSSRELEKHATNNLSAKETSRDTRGIGFSSTYTIVSLNEILGSNSAIQTILQKSNTPQNTLRAFNSIINDGLTGPKFYRTRQELLELLRILQSFEAHMRLANMPLALRTACKSSFKELDNTSVSTWSEESALKMWFVIAPSDFSEFRECKAFLKSQIGNEIQTLLKKNGRSAIEAKTEIDREWPGFCLIVQSTLNTHSKRVLGYSYQENLYTHSFSIRNRELSATHQRRLGTGLQNATQARVGRRIATLLTIRRDFFDGSFEKGSPAEDLSLAILNFRHLRPN